MEKGAANVARPDGKTIMICGFCGYEFDENEGKKGCGACAGGCHGIHCPRCNYKNLPEPAIVKKLKNILNKGAKK